MPDQADGDDIARASAQLAEVFDTETPNDRKYDKT